MIKKSIQAALIAGVVANLILPACILILWLLGGGGYGIFGMLEVTGAQALVAAPLVGLLVGWLGRWVKSIWLYLLAVLFSLVLQVLFGSLVVGAIVIFDLNRNLYTPVAIPIWLGWALLTFLPVGLFAAQAANRARPAAVTE